MPKFHQKIYAQPLTKKHHSAKFNKARLRLRAWHRYMAIFILLFVMLHMANHLMGVFGVEVYNSVQKQLRHVYKNPIIEPILIAAVIVQLCLGLVLLVKSMRQERPKGFWSWLQIISGILIILTISEHLIALYLARVINNLNTNFYWPLSVMDGPPFTYYFIPYYFLLVSSIFAHAAAGLHYIGLDRGASGRVDKFAIGLIIIGLLVATIIVLTLKQTFFDAALPPEWIEYLRQFSPTYTSPK